MSIVFLFEENPDVASASFSGAAVGGARSVPGYTALARTQSERRRRLALATGFRLLRLSGINRIAAQGSVAGRGWAGLDGRGF